MQADRSTFLVRNFPKVLREQIHALAILERKRIHEVLAELVEAGLQAHAAPPQTGEALLLPRHMAEAMARQMRQTPEARKAVAPDRALRRKKTRKEG